MARDAARRRRRRGDLHREVAVLKQHINHIKDIVSMQQENAHMFGLVETVSLADLVEDALKLKEAAFARRNLGGCGAPEPPQEFVHPRCVDGGDVAFDPAGNLYVTGTTESTNFPTTNGAFQTIKAGGMDGFLAKLTLPFPNCLPAIWPASSSAPSG